MWLIVGLGNPGAKYQLHRHNIGFILIDAMAEHLSGARNYKSEHSSEVLRTKLANQDVLLVKPQTFMNRSGEAVLALMSFYKISPENIVVAHDEIEQPFATIKFQFDRGHGGHNGVRNIHERIGNPKYHRVRIGVGRPENPQMDVASWVLQNFTNQEMKQVPKILEHCYQGVESLLMHGYQKTASAFNKTLSE